MIWSTSLHRHNLRSQRMAAQLLHRKGKNRWFSLPLYFIAFVSSKKHGAICLKMDGPANRGVECCFELCTQCLSTNHMNAERSKMPNICLGCNANLIPHTCYRFLCPRSVVYLSLYMLFRKTKVPAQQKVVASRQTVKHGDMASILRW